LEEPTASIFRVKEYAKQVASKRQVAGRALLAACFLLVSCLAYSLTVKMETICSSETSVDFHRTTWRYIPEDRTLRSPAVRTSTPTSIYLLHIETTEGLFKDESLHSPFYIPDNDVW
jgi:hypothetical protein